MGFETKVLNAVEEVTGESRIANFANGTMFVSCDKETAEEIKTFLLDEVVLCAIRVSPIEHKTYTEYAFDFI